MIEVINMLALTLSAMRLIGPVGCKPLRISRFSTA